MKVLDRRAAMASLAIAALIVVVWRAPAVYEWLFPSHAWKGWKPADQAAAVGQRRLFAAQTLLAVGGTIALGFTAFNYLLARRGQWTERFTKALERLDSPSTYARIGGIHALEHVLRESRRHHNDIVEVLVAFIRHQAPAAQKRGKPDDGINRPKEPAADVQAALTMLAYRRHREERQYLDFHGLHLATAVLNGANLTGAILTGADLTNAILTGADLTNAILAEADLTGANLAGANLTGANLFAATLTRSFALWATLTGANLFGAIVDDQGLLPAGWVRDPTTGRVGLQEGWGYDSWKRRLIPPPQSGGTVHTP